MLRSLFPEIDELEMELEENNQRKEFTDADPHMSEYVNEYYKVPNPNENDKFYYYFEVKSEKIYSFSRRRNDEPKDNNIRQARERNKRIKEKL